MNCGNVHPVPQIWFPLTSVSFQNFKLFFAGQRFSSNQEATASVEGYFEELRKNHYRDGIMALENR